MTDQQTIAKAQRIVKHIDTSSIQSLFIDIPILDGSWFRVVTFKKQKWVKDYRINPKTTWYEWKFESIK